MSYVTAKKKKLIFDYLDTPEEERIPVKEFLKKNGMIRVTFYKGELLYAQERAEEMKQARENMLKKRKAADGLGDLVSADDITKWAEMEKAIYQKGLGGTVKAQELYARLKGKLKDELNIKVGRLQDDDYYRIRNEAAREIAPRGRGKDKRDREVLSESALLLEKPRLDTEQDNQEND